MPKVHVKFVSGRAVSIDCDTWPIAYDYARDSVNLTNGKVARVLIDNRAVWDKDWDEASKIAGLH